MTHSQAQTHSTLTLSDFHKKKLLAIARNSIEQFLTRRELPKDTITDPELNHKQGVFVTLLKEGKLRGCIGHIKDDLPIWEAVSTMGLQAAINDNRFSPVKIDELPQIEIEISILSSLKRIENIDEIELGRDGVLLKKKEMRAVFLPQVATKMGWDRRELLDRLCNKIGLPDESWKTDAELYIFQTEIFDETEFQ